VFDAEIPRLERFRCSEIPPEINENRLISIEFYLKTTLVNLFRWILMYCYSTIVKNCLQPASFIVRSKIPSNAANMRKLAFIISWLLLEAGFSPQLKHQDNLKLNGV